jgi:hypothetical protein
MPAYRRSTTTLKEKKAVANVVLNIRGVGDIFITLFIDVLLILIE